MLHPHCFLPQGKDFPQFLVRKLGQPTFTCTNNFYCYFLLALDHFINLLFQGSPTDELVDLNVPGLADAERPVSGLVLYRWIPPAVKVEHMVGPGKV